MPKHFDTRSEHALDYCKIHVLSADRAAKAESCLCMNSVLLHPLYLHLMTRDFFFFWHSSWHWREGDLTTSSRFKNNHRPHFPSSKQRASANSSNNGTTAGHGAWSCKRTILKTTTWNIEQCSCHRKNNNPEIIWLYHIKGSGLWKWSLWVTATQVQEIIVP